MLLKQRKVLTRSRGLLLRQGTHNQEVFSLDPGDLYKMVFTEQGLRSIEKYGIQVAYLKLKDYFPLFKVL